MTCSIRVCVCVCSPRALFKGRNANCTQRKPPDLTVLGHTPTLSHKMMYLSADPRRRVRPNLSLERSERGPPSGPGPRAGTKIVKNRRFHFARVFRAETNIFGSPGAPETVKYEVFGPSGAPETVNYNIFWPPGAPETVKHGSFGHRKI